MRSEASFSLRAAGTWQTGSTQGWSLRVVWRLLRCSGGWGAGLAWLLLRDVGPCSWRPRLADQGWRAEVSSGVWSPGWPGRAAQEEEEVAAPSGLEEEVEACLCVWPQSGMEAGGGVGS